MAPPKRSNPGAQPTAPEATQPPADPGAEQPTAEPGSEQSTEQPTADPGTGQLAELRRQLADQQKKLQMYDEVFAVPAIRDHAEEVLGLRPAKQKAAPQASRPDLPPDRDDWDRHHWEQHEQSLVATVMEQMTAELDKRDRRTQGMVRAATEEERLRQHLGLSPEQYHDAMQRAQQMSPAERGAVVLRHVAGLDAPERAMAGADARRNGSRPVERPAPATNLPGPDAVSHGGGPPAPPDAMEQARNSFRRVLTETPDQVRYRELFGP